jgi:hypothetical protein
MSSSSNVRPLVSVSLKHAQLRHVSVSRSAAGPEDSHESGGAEREPEKACLASEVQLSWVDEIRLDDVRERASNVISVASQHNCLRSQSG